MQRILSVLLIAVCAAPVAAARQEQATELAGPPGWVLLQQGDPFAEPETSSVRMRYEMSPMGFLYGCDQGRSVSVFWLPSRPPATEPGSDTLVVTFSVNGAVAARQLMQRIDQGVWAWTDDTLSATRLPEAINAARSGVIGISGGGVSDAAAFDEDANGGAAELVLWACAR